MRYQVASTPENPKVWEIVDTAYVPPRRTGLTDDTIDAARATADRLNGPSDTEEVLVANPETFAEAWNNPVDTSRSFPTPETKGGQDA